ncbi:MAG: divalent metal cation transporter, partial [Longimicrobiales bacterium]
KGWRDPSMLRPMRMDLAAAALAMFAMGALLQIAGAASLHAASIPFETAEDLLRIFSLRLGRVGELILALGLWAATYSTFIGATGGYAVVATDTWREIRQRPPATLWAGDPAVRREPAYRILVAFWAFSPLYALLLGWEPIRVALVVNVLVMLLIPVLAIALLRLTASREIMGNFRNRLTSNIGLVLLILTSLVLVFSNGARWMRAGN